MRYVCSICGYVYDEAAGIPEQGIAPGTAWQELPQGFKCPLCGAPKDAFHAEKEETALRDDTGTVMNEIPEILEELSFGELSSLCSNLAKGCEKQYLSAEAGLFQELADYYQDRTEPTGKGSLDGLAKAVEQDLSLLYPEAGRAADSCRDRGAKRALVWSEKASRMLSSLLERCEKEQGAFLKNTNIYVCEICGFLYVGDEPPEICPVCKVPKLKISQIERS